ncbi:MAG: flavin reductase [Bacteroidota bacterium]
MRLNTSDIVALPKRYRTNLINSLSGFKSVNLVGSISADGITNLSVVSSVIHLGANPALMGFIMRPISVTRDTYDNIKATHSYTFNHLTTDFYREAHQASARYLPEESEFDAVGLTPQFGDRIKAPYVAESKVQIGLEWRDQKEIELNGTILMIGEVVEIRLPDEIVATDGWLDLEAANTLTCCGLDSYHRTQQLERLPYAKRP